MKLRWRVFLKTEIRFTDIPIVIDAALQHLEHEEVDELEIVLQKDQQARVYTNKFIKESLMRH